MRYFLLCLILCACSRERLVPVYQCEPSPEICDGRDNDCNDLTDENTEPCASACGKGVRTCEGTCSAPEPRAEICNGKDDDCDGTTDESTDLPIAPCYTGKLSDLQNGQCRFGLTRCIGGGEHCIGQTLPASETCNGLDDDCDGQSDEGVTTGSVDLVFVVDNSASMSQTIANVKTAANSFAVKYQDRTDIRWAIVGAPAVNSGNMPILVSNLSDAQTFAAAMQLQDGLSGTGEEPSIDAVIAIERNTLGLNWSGTKRAVVMLTDEEPQSYAQPRHTMSEAISGQNGLTIMTFTTQGFAYLWSPLGPTFDIQQDVAPLVLDLEKLIEGVSCGP